MAGLDQVVPPVPPHQQGWKRRGKGPRCTRARDEQGHVVRQQRLHADDGHVEADARAGVRGVGRAVDVRPRQPHARRGDELGLPAAPLAVRPRPGDPVRKGGLDCQVTMGFAAKERSKAPASPSTITHTAAFLGRLVQTY